MNSRLSSSEKGDSEAGDTFCCGRRTKRGMRLRDTSLSSCVLCSCSGRDNPSEPLGCALLLPSSRQGQANPGPSASPGRGQDAICLPLLLLAPVRAHLAALPQRPHRSQSRRSRERAPGMGGRDALSGAALPLELCFYFWLWLWLWLYLCFCLSSAPALAVAAALGVALPGPAPLPLPAPTRGAAAAPAPPAPASGLGALGWGWGILARGSGLGQVRDWSPAPGHRCRQQPRPSALAVTGGREETGAEGRCDGCIATRLAKCTVTFLWFLVMESQTVKRLGGTLHIF